jgi:molecular chaperone HscB
MWLWGKFYCLSVRKVNESYFELFALKQAFTIDSAALESQYRHIQSAAHPDRFVTASSTEKLKSMQLATLANEAYQTLKKPASRAKYLLLLQGIDATEETNTSMPADFLMQQMEWREALEDLKAAKDVDGLDALAKEMRQAATVLTTELTRLFDAENDLIGATATTRKLIFIDKVCEDIHKAITQIED